MFVAIWRSACVVAAGVAPRRTPPSQSISITAAGRLFTPRQHFIAAAAVLAIIGTVDFFGRVHVPRQPATRTMDAGNQGQLESPMPLAMARQRLQLAPGAGTAGRRVRQMPRAAILSAPIPDRAVIGGWQSVLRGVFDAGPQFAVFDVVSGTALRSSSTSCRSVRI